MSSVGSSPYLSGHSRLGEVIAAIQVMGSYGFYKLSFEDWSERISGNRSRADHWKRVFLEHPEFFRMDSTGEKASLAWRRSYRRRYSVDLQRELTFEEYSKLPAEQYLRTSRLPLTGSDISILINAAIELHTRAIEQNKEHRWLSSPLFNLLGVALGALLAFLFGQF